MLTYHHDLAGSPVLTPQYATSAVLSDASVLFVADGVLVERAWTEVVVDFDDGNSVVPS
jgi:hypothetical protein